MILGIQNGGASNPASSADTNLPTQGSFLTGQPSNLGERIFGNSFTNPLFGQQSITSHPNPTTNNTQANLTLPPPTASSLNNPPAASTTLETAPAFNLQNTMFGYSNAMNQNIDIGPTNETNFGASESHQMLPSFNTVSKPQKTANKAEIKSHSSEVSEERTFMNQLAKLFPVQSQSVSQKNESLTPEGEKHFKELLKRLKLHHNFLPILSELHLTLAQVGVSKIPESILLEYYRQASCSAKVLSISRDKRMAHWETVIHIFKFCLEREGDRDQINTIGGDFGDEMRTAHNKTIECLIATVERECKYQMTVQTKIDSSHELHRLIEAIQGLQYEPLQQAAQSVLLVYLFKRSNEFENNQVKDALKASRCKFMVPFRALTLGEGYDVNELYGRMKGEKWLDWLELYLGALEGHRKMESIPFKESEDVKISQLIASCKGSKLSSRFLAPDSKIRAYVESLRSRSQRQFYNCLHGVLFDKESTKLVFEQLFKHSSTFNDLRAAVKEVMSVTNSTDRQVRYMSFKLRFILEAMRVDASAIDMKLLSKTFKSSDNSSQVEGFRMGYFVISCLKYVEQEGVSVSITSTALQALHQLLMGPFHEKTVQAMCREKNSPLADYFTKHSQINNSLVTPCLKILRCLFERSYIFETIRAHTRTLELTGDGKTLTGLRYPINWLLDLISAIGKSVFEPQLIHSILKVLCIKCDYISYENPFVKRLIDALNRADLKECLLQRLKFEQTEFYSSSRDRNQLKADQNIFLQQFPFEAQQIYHTLLIVRTLLVLRKMHGVEKLMQLRAMQIFEESKGLTEMGILILVNYPPEGVVTKESSDQPYINYASDDPSVAYNFRRYQIPDDELKKAQENSSASPAFLCAGLQCLQEWLEFQPSPFLTGHPLFIKAIERYLSHTESNSVRRWCWQILHRLIVTSKHVTSQQIEIIASIIYRIKQPQRFPPEASTLIFQIHEALLQRHKIRRYQRLFTEQLDQWNNELRRGALIESNSTLFKNSTDRNSQRTEINPAKSIQSVSLSKKLHLLVNNYLSQQRQVESSVYLEKSIVAYADCFRKIRTCSKVLVSLILSETLSEGGLCGKFIQSVIEIKFVSLGAKLRRRETPGHARMIHRQDDIQDLSVTKHPYLMGEQLLVAFLQGSEKLRDVRQSQRKSMVEYLYCEYECSLKEFTQLVQLVLTIDKTFYANSLGEFDLNGYPEILCRSHLGQIQYTKTQLVGDGPNKIDQSLVSLIEGCMETMTINQLAKDEHTFLDQQPRYMPQPDLIDTIYLTLQWMLSNHPKLIMDDQLINAAKKLMPFVCSISPLSSPSMSRLLFLHVHVVKRLPNKLGYLLEEYPRFLEETVSKHTLVKDQLALKHQLLHLSLLMPDSHFSLPVIQHVIAMWQHETNDLLFYSLSRVVIDLCSSKPEQVAVTNLLSQLKNTVNFPRYEAHYHNGQRSHQHRKWIWLLKIASTLMNHSNLTTMRRINGQGRAFILASQDKIFTILAEPPTTLTFGQVYELEAILELSAACLTSRSWLKANQDLAAKLLSTIALRTQRTLASGLKHFFSQRSLGNTAMAFFQRAIETKPFNTQSSGYQIKAIPLSAVSRCERIFQSIQCPTSRMTVFQKTIEERLLNCVELLVIILTIGYQEMAEEDIHYEENSSSQGRSQSQSSSIKASTSTAQTAFDTNPAFNTGTCQEQLLSSTSQLLKILSSYYKSTSGLNPSPTYLGLYSSTEYFTESGYLVSLFAPLSPRYLPNLLMRLRTFLQLQMEALNRMVYKQGFRGLKAETERHRGRVNEFLSGINLTSSQLKGTVQNINSDTQTYLFKKK